MQIKLKKLDQLIHTGTNILNSNKRNELFLIHNGIEIHKKRQLLCRLLMHLVQQQAHYQ